MKLSNQPEKISLKIKGMHCASCSNIIETGLGQSKGVSAASVNLSTHTASVSFFADKISEKDIIENIEDMGYKVLTDSQVDTTQTDYLRRFWIALVLTLPVAITMFVSIPQILWFDIILLVFGAIVVFGSGRGFHVGFLKKLSQGQANMDTLISISTLIAYGYSIYAVIQTYIMDNPTMYYHFMEGASFIVTFILLGKYLETRSKGNASQAIQKLMQLQAKDAIVLRNDKEVSISIDDLVIGDIVVVRAGDKIPVDGVVSHGETAINESMLTGESMPVMKKNGDEVYSGTLVEDGKLHIQVTKEQTETMLSKIISFVDEAQSQKPPIQHLVDKISSVFVPVILVIAASAFVLHYTGNMTWLYDIIGRTITDLTAKSLLVLVSTIVIACPCAMGLATPMAITVASGTGASRGILIKSGETLEHSQTIDTVVFDKTGTLTAGTPVVSDIVVIDKSRTESELLSYAQSLTSHSHHPLSRAVTQHQSGDKKNETKEQDIKEVAGQGLASENMFFGNTKLLENNGIQVDKHITDMSHSLQEQGKTVNMLVVDKKIVGLIALRDEPKPQSIAGVQTLQDMGIDVIMISGDTEKTVSAIAGEIGIQTYHSHVAPGEKAELVKKLQATGKKVAFVGDGINDAPALAQSDLSIAVGQGSDIAIETAEMVLVHGDPQKVATAILLARKTYKIIKQNLFWAFGYNAVLVPIAALGLLMPWFASLAMSLSSVSVVLNSLRIKKV